MGNAHLWRFGARGPYRDHHGTGKMRLLGIDKVLTACAARVFVLAQPMVVHAVGPLSTYSFVPWPPPPLTG